MSDDDLRHTFIADQQEAAAERHHDVSHHLSLLMCSGKPPSPVNQRIMDRLVEKMRDSPHCCEHLAPEGPFKFPGSVYWFLGPNVFCCPACLDATLAYVTVHQAADDICDMCGQPEPINRFREFVITVAHILVLGNEGWTCCRDTGGPTPEYN